MTKKPIIQEKIRSKTFDLREFKGLGTPEEMVDYAREHNLQPLGRGSSRFVYTLSSRFALKIANPEFQRAGRAQNREEETLSKNPKVSQVVAKVYQHDPNYNWIVSDLVREPEDWGEIEEITGVSDEDIEYITGYDDDEEPPSSLQDIWNSGREELAENPFVKGLFELQNIGSDIADLNRSEQFGITPDRRVVVLDYGLTEDVKYQFYEHKIPTLMSMLYEKIRSKSFNLREFKTLGTPLEMVVYAKKHGLQFLGSGSSRIVYTLSSRFALKIANPYDMERAGRAQNREETMLSKKPEVKTVVAQVHQHDPQYNWIISDLVKPFEIEEGQTEIETKTNTSMQIISTLSAAQGYDENLEKTIKDTYSTSAERILQNPFVKGLIALSKYTKLSDLQYSPHQFGTAPDGRVVVLDYGFSQDVKDKFYSSNYSGNTGYSPTSGRS